ncbi:hypothetical protein ADL22_23035 [Streptomyces sp. NRRL F-4489]|uniref:TauD/TfdA family dioxygenase n=1 Tax=Streptomyces sp. NRRL F-4489 TaxID=1609095 RepID=UPI00074A3EBD|nr:TauD/TfdA family dioxygenase [Streptomyces sp. NRRL F-4489]KUL36996.1 hypothetical protein ADL22_23035 [Streptomyces sp. NRRL F-4489]
MSGAAPAGAVRLWPAGAGDGSPARAWRFRSRGADLLRTAEELTGRRLAVVRDVTVGMPGDDGELVAQQGDFWFHTDATFLPEPPHWMIIAVQEAHAGGELELLPSEFLDTEALSAEATYLTPDGAVHTPVWEPLPGPPGTGRLRYREDRMLAGGDAAAVDRAQQAVSDAAAHALTVGALAPGECLLVDNWTVLHRRRTFTGRRVIRRLWLDETG